MPTSTFACRRQIRLTFLVFNRPSSTFSVVLPWPSTSDTAALCVGRNTRLSRYGDIVDGQTLLIALDMGKITRLSNRVSLDYFCLFKP